jgi:acyl-CoA thioester hydrolase
MNLHRTDSLRADAHHYTVRVYYEDTDAAGIVYHATYLRYAERARTEALRDLGVPHAEMTSQHGLFFMVRRVEVDYLAPAHLDESLDVVTEPVVVRGASVLLRQTVRRAADARAVVVMALELVCVRAADQRVGRIPPRWRDALAAMGGIAGPAPTSGGRHHGTAP